MVETVIFKLIIDVFSFLFLDDIDNFINLNTAIDLHKNFGHFTKVQRRHYAGKIYYFQYHAKHTLVMLARFKNMV